MTDSQPTSKAALISSEDSIGPDMSAFFTRLGVLKVKTLGAQSQGRMLMIQDCISHHHFHEDHTNQAKSAIDRDQFLPYEKVLAVEHATSVPTWR